MELAQVTKQEEAGQRRAPYDGCGRAPQPCEQALARAVVAPLRQVAGVALGVRRERIRLPLALLRESVTKLVEVVLGRVTFADLAVLAGEIGQGVVELFDVLAKLGFRACAHGSMGAEAVCRGVGAAPSPTPSRSSLTAAVLKIGCLDTGSQAVSVNSFAARAEPLGSYPEPVSQ